MRKTKILQTIYALEPFGVLASIDIAVSVKSLLTEILEKNVYKVKIMCNKIGVKILEIW